MLKLEFQFNQAWPDMLEVVLILHVELENLLLLVKPSRFVQSAKSQQLVELGVTHVLRLFDAPLNETFGSLLLTVVKVCLERMLSNFFAHTDQIFES